MAKRKQRELAQKKTTSKRGKTRTKVNSAPKKSTKRTRAKTSAKKVAHRHAVKTKTKTKTKKQAIKPRARPVGPKKAAPQPTELSREPAEVTDEAVIVDIIEEPVPGVVVITEFESVRTGEPEAPGTQPEGKDSSERGEHLSR
jgi:hypothetical protein